MWRSTEFGLIIGRGDIVTIKKEVKHAGKLPKLAY